MAHELVVLGGPEKDPIREGEVVDLIRLVNERDRLQRRIKATAENMMRRLDVQGYVACVGPHVVEVERRKNGMRRERVLLLNTAEVFRAVEE